MALTVALLLTACSDGAEWRTKGLEADFPELAFELIADTGGDFTETQLEGTVTLLFFGFTSCPDACPTTMARLRAVIGELPESKQDELKVLFVSVDPARDDPERLAAYTRHYGPQFIGATHDLERVTKLANRYGSSFEHGREQGGAEYPVVHGSTVLAFDREGRARLLIRSQDSIEAIVHDLRKLLAA
ncbi:SCO family protein [Aquisalimonas sp.]|uniref:SCO family protein n=1 Tax=Aquisalimonas sp. TaxID=1872621 RepID=UPI0025C2331E|nr:SCO family protein [Aquisalimonas sp.]